MHYIGYIINQTFHLAKRRKQHNSQQISLKPGALAQARGMPSLRRDHHRGMGRLSQGSFRRALLAQRWGSSPRLKQEQHAQSSHASSLRRASLAWARQCPAQNKSFRLSESSSAALIYSCKSRLGKTGPFGRVCRTSPLFLPTTVIFHTQTIMPTISYIHNSIQLNQSRNKRKTTVITPTNMRVLASLTGNKLAQDS